MRESSIDGTNLRHVQSQLEVVVSWSSTLWIYASDHRLNILCTLQPLFQSTTTVGVTFHEDLATNPLCDLLIVDLVLFVSKKFPFCLPWIGTTDWNEEPSLSFKSGLDVFPAIDVFLRPVNHSNITVENCGLFINSVAILKLTLSSKESVCCPRFPVHQFPGPWDLVWSVLRWFLILRYQPLLPTLTHLMLPGLD